jgi:integrase
MEQLAQVIVSRPAGRCLPMIDDHKVISQGDRAPTFKEAKALYGIPEHRFRRGLASNLNRLGVDDSIIQSILRHSTVAVTQNCYIKTVRDDAVNAMRRYSEELKRANCSPDNDRATEASVQ